MERKSMIDLAHGNLLDADVDALVNTVNTVGVMGKGIALQFKRAYPDMFKAYASAVKRGDIQLGKMHVWTTGLIAGPRFVVNFPTKAHWRSNSRIGDVRAGLRDLVRVIEEFGISSIAIPPLGCGNGGLHWRDVEPLIREAMDALPQVKVILYPPEGAPRAKDMRNSSERPKMTPGRAALIVLLARYEDRAFETSLIEVQKLLYFLQVSGQALRLDYVKARYGPYADNLRHTLSEVEGHYLIGFGDGSARVAEAEPLRVLGQSAHVADMELAKTPDVIDRINRVLELVVGFESAYGMELLSTVHWIATHDQVVEPPGPDRVLEQVQKWSERKSRMFTQAHVEAAWDALDKQGWLDGAVHARG